MRVGIGYDVHPLKAGRDLILGGVPIGHPVGLDGHSDADVLTHAVIDALLGAAAIGDIGKLFPSTDSKFKGASSLGLLSTAAEAVRAAGYRVVNIDATVIAEEPRLHPHLHQMRDNIAASLKLRLDRVSVKATSPEGLGALGQKAGIAAQAVALIEEM
ncbi:MAG TPA: 2-C-methyl-D-erythritol 2,4-cyclodiphosphate synthase [Candidatus Dormibacteraeota bacterium]|nr:2-C-methyl-D-erythritol 2,4-cyclodiphosphate synthase [Candidatus Dormibacteraeota bacterium]